MTPELTSYAELAEVIGNIPLLLREARRARRLSLRKAATELDMSFSTVTRIEAGEDCALSNAVAVLRWLDRAGAVPVPGTAEPAPGEEHRNDA